jgi:hypothetical protein
MRMRSPDENSYNKHIANCEVYRAKEITKNSKLQESTKEEREKEKEEAPDLTNNTEPLIMGLCSCLYSITSHQIV